MTIKEIDFQLIQAKSENKKFAFTNEDETVYDMTGSSAKCFLYLTTTPTEIICTIDVPTGVITVPFNATHSADIGTYEYIIEETKATTEVVPIVNDKLEFTF